MNASPTTRRHLRRERWRLLREFERLLEGPLLILSFVWVVLLIVDLTKGLPHSLVLLNTAIWGVFALDFVLEFAIAPHKGRYLRGHWITALALALPAFRLLRIIRIFRVARILQATGSLSLARILTSLNRGITALRRLIKQRGIVYVAAMTALVTFVGAAGMAYFESPAALQHAHLPGKGLIGYGDALWWTAMTMTTMGSDYFPQTVDGRILGWLLAVYAFAIFGYITANIASFFVGQDAKAQTTHANADASATKADLRALRDEIAALRAQLVSPGPAPMIPPPDAPDTAILPHGEG